ncbi:Holliday junction DNA helicase ruvA [Agrobacterium tumefaciens]|nr:Holliday junction DNA helicase ruvA [Agrobacterium tumefaciens]
MIGKLKGSIEEIGADYVLVDVHGVCYVAYCSARTLSKIGSVGEAVVLFIETYVREDQLKLFGFLSALERNGSTCCRACRAWVRKWPWPSFPRFRPPNSPMPSRFRTR